MTKRNLFILGLMVWSALVGAAIAFTLCEHMPTGPASKVATPVTVIETPETFNGPYDTHCWCGYHTHYCTPDKGYVAACCTPDGAVKCETN